MNSTVSTRLGGATRQASSPSLSLSLSPSSSLALIHTLLKPVPARPDAGATTRACLIGQGDTEGRCEQARGPDAEERLDDVLEGDLEDPEGLSTNHAKGIPGFFVF